MLAIQDKRRPRKRMLRLLRGADSIRWSLVVWLGWMVCASPGHALQGTVAGRDASVDLLANLREVIESDRSSTHERTLEQVRVRGDIQPFAWLKLHCATLFTNGGPR
jgi:hypothetical protein